MELSKKEKQYLKALDRIEKKTKKLIEETAAWYVVELRRAFNAIAKKITWGWYKSYSPKEYKRYNYSLRKIPHMEINKKTGEWEISFSENRINGYHRVTSAKKKGTPEGGRKYLYELTFVKGWHGGADSGPPDKLGQPHPHVGLPYWRKPIPEYTQWGYLASRYDRKIGGSIMFPEDEERDYQIDSANTSHSVRDEIMDEFHRQRMIIENLVINDFARRFEILKEEMDEAERKYLS